MLGVSLTYDWCRYIPSRRNLVQSTRVRHLRTMLMSGVKMGYGADSHWPYGLAVSRAATDSASRGATVAAQSMATIFVQQCWPRGGIRQF
jgi:hypothetical protein